MSAVFGRVGKYAEATVEHRQGEGSETYPAERWRAGMLLHGGFSDEAGTETGEDQSKRCLE